MNCNRRINFYFEHIISCRSKIALPLVAFSSSSIRNLFAPHDEYIDNDADDDERCPAIHLLTLLLLFTTASSVYLHEFFDSFPISTSH